MAKRHTYQPAQPSKALTMTKMAGAGALIAAGPTLGWLILVATLGGHQ